MSCGERPSIVLLTGNQKKLEEFVQILGPDFPYQVNIIDATISYHINHISLCCLRFSDFVGLLTKNLKHLVIIRDICPFDKMLVYIEDHRPVEPFVCERREGERWIQIQIPIHKILV